MPLSVIQTQVLSSHLTALTHVLCRDAAPDSGPHFSAKQVISSLVSEIGPFTIPMIVNSINRIPIEKLELNSKQLEELLDLLGKAEDEVNTCLESEYPPSATLREIFAQLLELIAPLIIKILIGFLQEPDTDYRNKFAPML